MKNYSFFFFVLFRCSNRHGCSSTNRPKPKLVKPVKNIMYSFWNTYFSFEFYFMMLQLDTSAELILENSLCKNYHDFETVVFLHIIPERKEEKYIHKLNFVCKFMWLLNECDWRVFPLYKVNQVFCFLLCTDVLSAVCFFKCFELSLVEVSLPGGERIATRILFIVAFALFNSNYLFYCNYFLL